MRSLRSHAWSLMGLSATLALFACGSDNGDGLLPPAEPLTPDTPAIGGGGVPGKAEPPVPTATATYLERREADYGAAFRIAVSKLALRFPTMEEIKQLESASDKKAEYAKLIDAVLASKEFASGQIKFWRDTFRTGDLGTAPAMGANANAAAFFAASLVVSGKPYTDLFTASTGTCPTFDGATGTFTAANCGGAGPTAGVLTDPGLMKQYFANMAFRRARFVQETFACSKFPAEFSDKPIKMGAGYYNSPWDFQSITGKQNKPDAKIDFHDAAAVVCAGCHSTMNHQAPLFMNFDDKGVYNAAQVGVLVPVPGTPKATLVDFLPAGQQTAWRSGKAATDLPAFGAAMAVDPSVQRCAVTRAWNFALSRGDVVADISPVPATVSDPLLAKFASGFNFKALLRDIFVSEDFTKF
jgi:hypothetical protein